MRKKWRGNQRLSGSAARCCPGCTDLRRTGTGNRPQRYGAPWGAKPGWLPSLSLALGQACPGRGTTNAEKEWVRGRAKESTVGPETEHRAPHPRAACPGVTCMWFLDVTSLICEMGRFQPSFPSPPSCPAAPSQASISSRLPRCPQPGLHLLPAAPLPPARPPISSPLPHCPTARQLPWLQTNPPAHQTQASLGGLAQAVLGRTFTSQRYPHSSRPQSLISKVTSSGRPP